MTQKSNMCIIIGLEHTSRWPVAKAIPPSMFNAKGTINFQENEIIIPFGSLEYILSDNDQKFDCMTVHDFTKKHGISWKYTSTYKPQGNSIAERMVGTLKKAIQPTMKSRGMEWDECLEKVLYGCRRRKGSNGSSPFGVIFGVTHRFSGQQSNNSPLLSFMEKAQMFEIVRSYVDRAEIMVLRSVSAEYHRFKVGDMVLLRTGIARRDLRLTFDSGTVHVTSELRIIRTTSWKMLQVVGECSRFV